MADLRMIDVSTAFWITLTATAVGVFLLYVAPRVPW